MIILKPTDKWPSTWQKNLATGIPEPLDYTMNYVVACAFDQFEMEMGHCPTHLLIGPNFTNHYKSAIEPHAMRTQDDARHLGEEMFMGLRVRFTNVNGIEVLSDGQ